jgi:hypothetical protein
MISSGTRPTCSDHNSWTFIVWGHIYTLWKGLKILYQFHIVHFFWLCTMFNQQSFVRSSSVKIKIWVTILSWLFTWSFGLLSLLDGWNVDFFLPCFQQMEDYPYATLRADGWFRCGGLHRPSFPILLGDMLHCFGYTGTPHIPWSPVPSFQTWVLQGPCGHSGSPHWSDHHGLVHHG